MSLAGDWFGSLFTIAAESMGSYHGNRKAGNQKKIFYTTSFIPPSTFSLPTGASSHIRQGTFVVETFKQIKI